MTVIGPQPPAGALIAGDAGKKLDEGLLDPAWFGPGVEFRTTETIDYVWVKPGFTIKESSISRNGPTASFSAKSARAGTPPRLPS